MSVVVLQYYQYQIETKFKLSIKRTEIARSCDYVFNPSNYLSQRNYGDYLLGFRQSEQVATDIAFLTSGFLSLIITTTISSFWLTAGFFFPALVSLLLGSLLLNFGICFFSLPYLARRINYQNLVERRKYQKQSAGSTIIPFTNFLKVRGYLFNLFTRSETRSMRDRYRAFIFESKLDFIYFIFNTTVYITGFWLILEKYNSSQLSAAESFGAFFVMNFCLSNIKNFSDYPVRIISINQTLKMNHKIFQKLEAMTGAQIEKKPAIEQEPIHIHHLEYRWNNGHTYRASNLYLNPGEWIAIKGENGAGKSTILKALSGLLPVTKISWSDSGATYNTFQKELVTYVSVHDALFKGTPEENVHFFSTDPEDKLKAGFLLGLTGFYENLGHDVDFQFSLGPNGEGISRGQKQRILIARALFKRPRVMILDEATSGLDASAEILIFEAIRQFFPDLTILYVNHREENKNLGFKQAEVRDGVLHVV
jgi:ABC-type bacteriocin/lantibiotic exporter with double-glycine peptidase domain